MGLSFLAPARQLAFVGHALVAGIALLAVLTLLRMRANGPDLFLAGRLAKRVLRRSDRQLVPQTVGHAGGVFGREGVKPARRVLHRELGGDDPRRLVMRVGPGARVLGRNRPRR